MAVLVALLTAGCSVSRPATAHLVTSGTLKGNNEVKSSKPVAENSVSPSGRGVRPLMALPTEKPMGDYQKQVVEEAWRWVGTPYQYARAERDSGTDCSGMVMMVYDSALQVKIPRNSARQAEVCIRLAPEEVEGGDLVFFATGKDSLQVSHVGIMLPDGVSFIHASSSKGVVVSSLTGTYYRPRILMYGRVPAMDALMSTARK